MKKAWSFFWLVVAWCVAGSIIAALIAPYLWIIALIVSVAITSFVGFKVYRAMTSHRSHF